MPETWGGVNHQYEKVCHKKTSTIFPIFYQRSTGFAYVPHTLGIDKSFFWIKKASPLALQPTATRHKMANTNQYLLIMLYKNYTEMAEDNFIKLAKAIADMAVEANDFPTLNTVWEELHGDIPMGTPYEDLAWAYEFAFHIGSVPSMEWNMVFDIPNPLLGRKFPLTYTSYEDGLGEIAIASTGGKLVVYEYSNRQNPYPLVSHIERVDGKYKVFGLGEFEEIEDILDAVAVI